MAAATLELSIVMGDRSGCGPAVTLELPNVMGGVMGVGGARSDNRAFHCYEGVVGIGESPQ